MNIKTTAGLAMVTAAFSFLGGFAAEIAFRPTAAVAQGQSDSYFALRDTKNAKGITTYVNDGQPGQIFYGENGQMRLQMGTYNGADERGLPLIALSDTNGHIRLLFRLAGENESPVLIMKDKNGSDRIVMGLQLSGGQNPFLHITNDDGSTKDVFGVYR
ncbi:MAG TPA: hypothetical protein VEF76_05315 [Patescibacteria group bacterium]|nr:hypothetical protein [Patescibacteria group bacterium]